MLSSTVYQGKSAGSWKTTARLGSGRSTRTPFTRTSPRVGRSKPATMLRSVDLPQPEGPSRAANSFTSTATSIACSASTRRPRLTKSFHTSRSWIDGPRASAMSLESPPAPEDARGPVGRVHDDRIKGREPDEEERARVVDAEDGDGERQPGRDRDGPEELDRRIDQVRHETVPPDEEAERDPERRGDEEALEHAARRVEDVGQPGARVGREARARGAEDPPVPGFGDLRGRRD